MALLNDAFAEIENVSFKDFLGELQKMVNEHLDSYLVAKGEQGLAVDSNYPSEELFEAMRYSVINGGKRIRPVLCCMIVKALNEIDLNFLRAGCAVELIHAYSLIHDDLPAMDNADLRRGKPSNHKVYGEANAILAGDALLTTAFEWLSNLNLKDKDNSKLYRENIPIAIRILAECAGAKGMVGGQSLDLKAEGKKVGIDYLLKIHEGKTGALLEAPLLIGFVLATSDLVGFSTLKEYGKKIGLLFQIVDDILDVEGDEIKLGKAVGKDAELDKATYPSIIGLKRSKEYAAQTHDEALRLLDRFVEERKHALPNEKCDLTRFYQLTDYLLNRQS